MTRLRIERAATVPLLWAWLIGGTLVDLWLLVMVVRTVRAVWGMR